jgi:choice-of-anchor A domain-containing protein
LFFSTGVCGVFVSGFCAGKRVSECPQEPSVSYFQAEEPVLFADYNAVSFGNFLAKNGDTEGRVLVKGNLDVENYDVGLLVQTGGTSPKDRHVPYSLVVGRDGKFINGQVHPSGNNIPYVSAREEIFVGGTFTAGNDPILFAQRTGACPANAPGCLDADFSSALIYYKALQQAFAE